METESKASLSGQTAIKDLFRVLEENGMDKERQELGILVDYLDNMENQFGQVLEELKEVRGQLEQLGSKGIKENAVYITEQAESRVQQFGGQLDIMKKNLIVSAKKAVDAFKEGGKEVLQKVVSAMKISSALSIIKEACNSGVEDMNRNAEKMETINSEFQEIGNHARNIARTLFSKEKKEEKQQNPDKGIILKIRKAFLTCGSFFESMEYRTGNAIEQIEYFCNEKREKTSVKAEIMQIKSRKHAKPDMQQVLQDKAR